MHIAGTSQLVGYGNFGYWLLVFFGRSSMQSSAEGGSDKGTPSDAYNCYICYIYYVPPCFSP